MYLLRNFLLLLIIAAISPMASAVIDARIKASRTNCISPCTVVFSAENTTDSRTPDEHEVFTDLGYHFYFDDTASTTFRTTGLSKNTQIGGPLAAHTFICGSGNPKYSGGRCVFSVSMRAKNTAGEYDDATVNVTVHAPADYYSAANTVCVSTSGNWSGCPSGAARVSQVPDVGDYSGKRILLRRGEKFGKICIGYQESNVLVEPFGDGQTRPELLESGDIGVDGKCGDIWPDGDSEIATYPKNWAENITITGVRAPGFSFGMSYTHVSVHDVDMNYRNQPDGGSINLASSAEACLSSGFSCSKVPYPKGAYLTESTIIGSEQAASSGSGVLVNIGAFTCPMINWIALLGNEAWNADEHNYRSEGTWRGVWAHNEMRGHHHNSGKKHAITIRSCGYGDIDPEVAVYRHNSEQNTINAPRTRYGVVADNILGSSDSTQASWKLQIAPTNNNSPETLQDFVVERNRFIDSSVSSSIDMALGGMHLTSRVDNIYSPNKQDCVDVGQNSILDGFYLPSNCEGAVPPIPARPLSSIETAPPAKTQLTIELVQ